MRKLETGGCQLMNYLEEEVHSRQEHAMELSIAVLVHDGQVPAGKIIRESLRA
jgi:hypothetical protein